jgi:trigger factor
MQVSLTATGGLERRLEVAVPAERVQGAVEERLREISRTARLKGFRPGKAPMVVVKQQFGSQVHAEVVSELLRSTFSEALTQEKLTPAAGPKIEPLAMAPGSELRYAAVFEILPEIQPKSPESFTIERPVAEVTDADLEAMLESMRRQRPVFREVEREARETDRATVDFEGRLNGALFEGGTGTDVPFIIGSGRLLPDFDVAVRGLKVGETRQVPVSFPADYGSQDLAGQTAQFTITLKRLEEQSLPPIDEEFAKAFGVAEGSVETLREEVRASMERELNDAVRNRVRTQVLDALYRENPLELPRTLVEEQVQELQADMLRRMNQGRGQNAGNSAGQKPLTEIPPREPFEEPARRRVALGLLLGEIIRSQQIKLDRSRVQGRLADITSQYPNGEEMRRAYLQNADAMRQIESAVLEDQAIDWVLSKAQNRETPVTFRELTGFSSTPT